MADVTDCHRPQMLEAMPSSASRIHIYDDVLPDPHVYMGQCLAQPFTSVSLGAAVFQGIAPAPDSWLAAWIERQHPGLTSSVSFCRQSPAGQAEPNFIHNDCDMGDWTAIAYLTAEPRADDGTTFWRARDTGAIESGPRLTGEAQLEEASRWRNLSLWEPWLAIAALFNRVILFPANLYHSRTIPENYGSGAGARLVQVVFGTGRLGEA